MIAIDDLANEIAKALSEYSDEIAKGVSKAVDTTAREVDAEIKDHISFTEHSGEYVDAFRITTTQNKKTGKRKIWHVADGQAGLTHLLENGHALDKGGRTRAFPHIKYGDELAKKRLEELIREVIKNA